MKNYNQKVFANVVRTADKTLRRYCEWLIGAPTFGARLFENLAKDYPCSSNDKQAFPETVAMLKRHFAGDPELVKIKNDMQITEQELKNGI